MELSDVLSATSILLVFVMLTFEKLITSVNSVLQIKCPDRIKETEYKSYCNVIRATFAKTLIAFIFLLIIFYIFLPLTWKIIINSEINLWKFDLLETLFVIIEICILSIVLYVGYLVLKVFATKNKNCK